MNREQFKSVEEWIRYFDHPAYSLGTMVEIYGNDQFLIQDRIKDYKAVLQRYRCAYDDRDSIVIARSPGRVNIMGKHIDHQGGHVNVMAINREILLAASARDDDEIRMVNTDRTFGDRAFRISECFPEGIPEDWFRYIESEDVLKSLTLYAGDWMNYVKGAVLRLQYEYKDRKLYGMNMAFTGNIPLSAGLSGSSALVVSTMEAFLSVNKIELPPKRFVEICGEGEWYVGLKNGISDPASMKYAQKGQLVKLSFNPFAFEKTFDFPRDYKLVVADSHVKAGKAGNSKDGYNQRVATYELGMMLLKELFPEKIGKLQYLRDIRNDSPCLNTEDIYRMILALPEKLTPVQLFLNLPQNKHEEIRRLLKTHTPYPEYHIRAVILYGIAECHRARLCSELLRHKKIEEFGELMTISHNGDRVSRLNSQGTIVPFNWYVTDGMLVGLIEDLNSKNPERIKRAALERQRGGYSCSVPEIDFMIDKALSVQGVLGAQISGAGLGGCMMALIRADSTEALTECLVKEYYEPLGLEHRIIICSPVKGSGCLEK